jgi:hypothetical protein
MECDGKMRRWVEQNGMNLVPNFGPEVNATIFESGYVSVGLASMTGTGTEQMHQGIVNAHSVATGSFCAVKNFDA